VGYQYAAVQTFGREGAAQKVVGQMMAVGDEARGEARLRELRGDKFLRARLAARAVAQMGGECRTRGRRVVDLRCRRPRVADRAHDALAREAIDIVRRS